MVPEQQLNIPSLPREQLLEQLNLSDPKDIQELRRQADRTRQQWVGDAVHLRGIIEFSNYCHRNCAYCGINHYNRQLPRYRMSPESIIATARQAAAMGFKTIVLQSGEDAFYTADMLADVVKEIKTTGLAVTLSVGERPARDYHLWRAAGADRYLLKFETSHPGLYSLLHPGSSLEKRLHCLEDLRALGYQVGSGCMVGLPGQTTESLADDLLLMWALRLEMAGIGPFIPHPGTTLAAVPAGSVLMSLKMLALARLMLPWAHLPATTALSSLDTDGRQLGLEGGANVLMPNLTPLEYRRFYEIYPQKAEVEETPAELYAATKRLLARLGRPAAEDAGHGLFTNMP